MIAHDEYGVPLMILCLKLSRANISETGYRHTHLTDKLVFIIFNVRIYEEPLYRIARYIT